MTATPPVPVTLLGGYLGAGKTTLVNRLLASTDRPVAVLVNDVGAINVDAALVASHNGDTIELSNGCVCCSFGDGFAEAFLALRQRTSPVDQVLIELSGVADPAKVRDWASTKGFALDGVVVLVDADQFLDRLQDRWVGDTVERQVLAADLLVVTKTDLAGSDGVEHVAQRLTALAPQTPVVLDDRGDVGLVAVSPGGAPKSKRPPARPAQDSPAAHRTESVETSCDSAEDLERLLDSRGPDVVRIKGIIRVADEVVVVHQVGRRRTVTPAPDSSPTGLVIIHAPHH